MPTMLRRVLSGAVALLVLAGCAGPAASTSPTISGVAVSTTASLAPAGSATGASSSSEVSTASAPASTSAAVSTSPAGSSSTTMATSASASTTGSESTATTTMSAAITTATGSGTTSSSHTTSGSATASSTAAGSANAASTSGGKTSGSQTGGSTTAQGGVGADWATYHRNLARSGNDPASPAFQHVAQAWQSDQLDGDVYAEPLLVGSRLLVVTENDSIYSLDAASGRVQWRQHVGEPVPGSALPCGDIDPSGITSTPVVDTAAGLLYAVAFTQPVQHELVAVDLASGAVRFRKPIDPPGADARVQQQRSALALSRGVVYVAYGGLDGDCGAYHGWLVAAAAATGAVRANYEVPVQREGAIWAPSGPAIDADGNIYVATGNGEATSVLQHSDAVLKLSPDLKVLGWFAPTNWQQLDNTDADIGSVGPALLDGGLIFQIGKSGTGYLLRSTHLGNLGGEAFAGPVCSGAFGGTAYAAPYVYVPCRDGLVAVQVAAGPSFRIAWRGPAALGDSPVVAGGVVWAVDAAARELRGLDAQDGQARFVLPLPAGGQLPHFITPTAAGGKVYLAAGRLVVAFAGS